MQNKKAAMFGLDARIALAIFGALSVISGAALYSAIQEAKVVSIITDINELGKAVDAYQLDTGELPAFDTFRANNMNLNELLTSTKQNWQGPYLNAKLNSTLILNFEHSKYDYIGVRRMETSSWGNSNTVACNSVATPCALYIVLANIPKSLATAIDLKVDGTGDYENGKIRVYDNTGVPDGDWAVFVNYRPYSYK